MNPSTKVKNNGDRVVNRRITGSVRRGEHDPSEENVQDLPQGEEDPIPPRRLRVFTSKKKRQQGHAPDLPTHDLHAPDLPTEDIHVPDLAATDLHAPNLATTDLHAPDSNLKRHNQREGTSSTAGPPNAHEGDHSDHTQKNRRSRNQPDFEPVLIGEAPGGPIDPSILISFEAHIAFDIYRNIESRGYLRIHQRPKQLKEWKPPTDFVRKPRWWALVEASGLSHLHSAMHVNINYPLINAFSERWLTETNSFHLPFGLCMYGRF